VGKSEAAHLLAGATYVESAMLVEQLDEVANAISASQFAAEFASSEPGAALAWLQSAHAGAAALRFSDFLQHHGHRSYRELDLREKAWVDQPEKLVLTLQATVTARLGGNEQSTGQSAGHAAPTGFALRWLLPKAHNAIRRRERTKSLLVEATQRLKRGYRHLGNLLRSEGHLADSDQVFFFTHEELRGLCERPSPNMAERAEARRKALNFHTRMEFADICVGKPEPLAHGAPDANDDSQLVGRPASLGVAEGLARVALTLEEAAQLQAGEILIAPITDVGWTPYFSMIAGLATDVGSAVSHGAVIAREYGLPAIVNLRCATKVFKTGDYVLLDADHGILKKLDREA
jgi:pyruvate,water dikinase